MPCCARPFLSAPWCQMLGMLFVVGVWFSLLACAPRGSSNQSAAGGNATQGTPDVASTQETGSENAAARDTQWGGGGWSHLPGRITGLALPA